MSWLYGVDSSFDELTEREADDLWNEGARVFAQCLWTGGVQPAPRVINLRVAQQRGFALVGYISVSPNGRTGTSHVNMGRAGVPDDLWNALVKVPIDVELPGLTFAMVTAALDRVAELGKPRDVYTSYNAWVSYLGNPTRPEGTGLWNAYWDEHPDFDFPNLRYGDWLDEEVWGEQWSGDTNVGGQHVDRNQFVAEAFGLGEPPPPLEPPPPPLPGLDLARIAADLRRLAEEISP